MTSVIFTWLVHPQVPFWIIFDDRPHRHHSKSFRKSTGSLKQKPQNKVRFPGYDWSNLPRRQNNLPKSVDNYIQFWNQYLLHPPWLIHLHHLLGTLQKKHIKNRMPMPQIPIWLRCRQDLEYRLAITFGRNEHHWYGINGDVPCFFGSRSYFNFFHQPKSSKITWNARVLGGLNSSWDRGPASAPTAPPSIPYKVKLRPWFGAAPRDLNWEFFLLGCFGENRQDQREIHLSDLISIIYIYIVHILLNFIRYHHM